jgi:hypothetical protein
VVSYGPSLDVIGVWDREGAHLDRTVNPWFAMFFRRSSSVFARYFREHELLRPDDIASLQGPIGFDRSGWTIDGETRLVPQVTLAGLWATGQAVNLTPAAGLPTQGPSTELSLTLTLQPTTPLRIDTTLVSSRLETPDGDRQVFSSRIIRSKLNWQMTRELALRTIVQHELLAVDNHLSALTPSERLNVDLLASFIVNPWTAVYVGYNGNARSLRDLPGGLHKDAQQFFAKVSYLYRF